MYGVHRQTHMSMMLHDRGRFWTSQVQECGSHTVMAPVGPSHESHWFDSLVECGGFASMLRLLLHACCMLAVVFVVVSACGTDLHEVIELAAPV